MRKHTRLLAALSVLICVFSLGANAKQGITAGLLMRLSTRTGPGTQYDEPGTYFQNSWSATQVQVISSAWDKYNKIWWVQVDFTASGKKFRAYTGLKRVSVDINSLYQEQALGSAMMTSAARAYWGPGRDYTEAQYNVPNHTSVTVYGSENGFVQVEFYDARTATDARSLRRAWVTASAVSGHWASLQSTVPGNQSSSTYRFCPYCRSDLGSDNAFVYCPYCGNALWNSSIQPGQTQYTGLPQKPWTGTGKRIYLKSLVGDDLRPQCGPDSRYPVFFPEGPHGEPHCQRGRIREIRALFTAGAYVLASISSDRGQPGIGYFPQSLFQAFEGVPAFMPQAARSGVAATQIIPYNGPGYHYTQFNSCRLDTGDLVQVFFEEGGWYYCEFYTKGIDYGWVHLWLPANSIQLL
jgi:uncharacterized protein YraI